MALERPSVSARYCLGFWRSTRPTCKIVTSLIFLKNADVFSSLEAYLGELLARLESLQGTRMTPSSLVFLQMCGLFLKDDGVEYNGQSEQDPAGFVQALVQHSIQEFQTLRPGQPLTAHPFKAALATKVQQKVSRLSYSTQIIIRSNNSLD